MSGFVMVPYWLLNQKPTGNDVLVYANLAKFGTWNPGTGRYDECRPSIARLCRETDLSESSIRRSLKNLVKLGGIVPLGTRHDEDGGQLPTVYAVVFGVVTAPPVTGDSPPPSTGDSPGVPPVEPNQEPPTQNQDTKKGFDAETAPTAQTIIAAFIDWIGLPAQGGVRLSKRVISIYAKSIKELLGEGFSENLIKMALAAMLEKGLTDRPTLLHNFVVQVQQAARPVSAPPAPRTFRQMDADDRQHEDRIVQAMGVILDQEPEMEASEARKIVLEMVAAEQLNLNALKTSAPTGYIGEGVIVSEVREVTGS